MKQNEVDIAVKSGAIGLFIGSFSMLLILGCEINRLEKKNRESYELHKQLVDETKRDLEDDTMSERERWVRMANRLNFITTAKSM